MYRVTYENSLPQCEKRMGRFNDLPPNLIPITQKEWIRLMMLWSVVAMDYRQPIVNKNFSGAMKMFYFTQDSGVALQGASVHGRHARFYTFAACLHQWRAPTEKEHREKNVPRPGRCYLVSVCSTCGAVNAVDSSG